MLTFAKPAPPNDDKRWRLVDATMRRHGQQSRGLIEALHTVQEAFGYLDDLSLRYVATSLRVRDLHWNSLLHQGSPASAGRHSEGLGRPPRRDHAGRKSLFPDRALSRLLWTCSRRSL